MSAQTHTLSLTTLSQRRFNTLDVVGISLSTLLFTLVWVGVFSVFLPEKTTLLFSDGLKQASSGGVPHSELTVLQNNLKIAQDRLTDGVYGGIVALLSVVQTGGSMQRVGETFVVSVSSDEVSHMVVRSLPDTAVLGAATSDMLIESGISERLLHQSYIYINTVSFGLLDHIDPELELAMGSLT